MQKEERKILLGGRGAHRVFNLKTIEIFLCLTVYLNLFYVNNQIFLCT